MQRVALATEDELSEAVGVRLLAEHRETLEVGLLLRRGGNGYLRSRLANFCQMARLNPMLVITDLDKWTCPAVLCAEWLGRTTQPEKLLLRVAVREIEAWLLADHEAMGALLGQAVASRLPMLPEAIENLKEFLLGLAARAPRDVRADLCAEAGAVARQALGYNARLSTFVREIWHPERASSRSDSLRRARERIRQLAMVVPPVAKAVTAQPRPCSHPAPTLTHETTGKDPTHGAGDSAGDAGDPRRLRLAGGIRPTTPSASRASRPSPAVAIVPARASCIPPAAMSACPTDRWATPRSGT